MMLFKRSSKFQHLKNILNYNLNGFIVANTSSIKRTQKNFEAIYIALKNRKLNVQIRYNRLLLFRKSITYPHDYNISCFCFDDLLFTLNGCLLISLDALFLPVLLTLSDYFCEKKGMLFQFWFSRNIFYSI